MAEQHPTAAAPELIAARRIELIAAIEEVRAAGKEVKALLDKLDQSMRRAVGQLERGASANKVVSATGLPDRRAALNDSAARMRLARYECQRAMFRLAIAEGISKSDIARQWRVSRQLVSRTARELGPL